MASIFGHAATALTATALIKRKVNRTKLNILAIFCASIPDADVLMFRFGFSYSHWLGHRGFFHSIFFALFLAILIKVIFYNKYKWSGRDCWLVIGFFSLMTISHGVLDAMTTGGRGIAFFSPFDNTRHFLPWRVIQVSPLGAGRFFSEWGIAVLKSEFIFIGIPCLLILAVNKVVNLIKPPVA
ncbi:MAG: metal-dependent hydrolase [Saprospiraceae bacterium]|nr:metal-dependent hydrolase [Saprospiraceae bacterium]